MNTNAKTRVPVEVNNINYNFCKNPQCKQFGLPISQEMKKGGNTYNLTGVSKGGIVNIPHAKCNCCGDIFPLKSNLGIAEEVDRLYSYLKTEDMVHSCSNQDCANHSVPLGTKKAYIAFGTTASGGKRYRCNLCKKTFTISKPTAGQHDTHHNIEIFKLLMNKVPLSRIINILDIHWNVLYHRINFIHKQCVDFASNREKQLKNMPIDRLYLSIDRQEYSVNWNERKDKRNIILTSIASADNKSGYVFGMNPNFDGSIDIEEIEEDALNIGEETKTVPFRKYARLWLKRDYIESANRKKYYKSKKPAQNLKEEISNTYNSAQQREDIEAFDEKTNEQKLPNYGAQVKAEYTMIAHFHLLKKMMKNVEKWRFFLDQDSGIRGACLSAFQKEISEHTTEAFYVRIEKNLTVDEKRKLKAKAKKEFDKIKNENSQLSDNEVKIEMLKIEIVANTEIGDWKDKWIKHPLPNMAEANKAMCWLTEHDEGDMDLTHKAWLYNKASMHGVDSFFQKVRRRIAMLERPIESSSTGRTYNGYGAYNPSMIVKLLEIFRVVHNYIDTKKEDGVVTTPAMRLGLAQAPLDYKTVLYNE